MRWSAVALLLLLALSLRQGLLLRDRIGALELRTTKLQSKLDAKAAVIQAAQPPDFVQTLPASPLVAQIMQTLQKAAATEGARVDSLQADDHPPTDTALGHLDLALSIKAPYPSILIVLQQVLDRYPGAALRQFDLTRAVAPTTTPMAPSPLGAAAMLPSMTESEAHVLLSFWHRPAGVGQVADSAPPAIGASSASGPAIATAPSERPVSAMRTAQSVAPPASGAR